MKKILMVSLLLIGIVIIFIVFIRQPSTTFSGAIENMEDIDRIAIGEHVDGSSDEDFFQSEFFEETEEVEDILSVLNNIELEENRGWFREEINYGDRKYHIVFYDQNNNEIYTLITYGDQVEITSSMRRTLYSVENDNSYLEGISSFTTN